MGLSPGARRAVEAEADRVLGDMKAVYRERLLTIQEAFEPPLRNSELSLGLELSAPAAGASEVARFVSVSPRLRRVVPDPVTRAAVDRIMAGEMVIAAKEIAGKRRREVVIFLPVESARLGPGWSVVSFAEPVAVPVTGDAFEDAAVWDLFGTAPADTGVAANVATGPESGSPSVENETAAATGASLVNRARKLASERRRGPASGSVVTRSKAVPAAQARRDDTDGTRPARAPNAFRRHAIALGCMRLSTKPDRPSHEAAIAVVLRALDGGVRVLDTADSYCLDASEVGHNERLIATALERWAGPRDEVLVATKVGLTRPDGKWVPKANKRYIAAACDASLKALGVDQIGLYQLHLVDPYVPLDDSLGALIKLRDQGKIARIGVCNVSPFQLLDVLAAIPDLASVQIPLSCFDASSVRSGVVGVARDHDVPIMAYAPLGGWKGVARAGRNRQLNAVAALHSATPHEVALAWLLSLDARILPLVGATCLDSVESSLSAAEMTLGAEDLGILDARFDKVSVARESTFALPGPDTAVGGGDGAEIVLVMGIPAAGKTTRVEHYTAQGYERLNRDVLGGTLKDLLPVLERGLVKGEKRFVMDNTYPDRMARRAVLEVASRHGATVAVDWVQTSLEEAQVNAVNRMLDRYGKLLAPDEMRAIVKRDPNMFPPNAQYKYRRRFEAPTVGEGFSRVTALPFERRANAENTGKALFLDFDGTLRTTLSGAPAPNEPSDVALLPNRRPVLLDYIERGYRLIGVSNQGGVALGHLTETQAQACIDRTLELLDLPVVVESVFCAHPPGAPKCWCRKPMPGWGVHFVRKYGLDPSQCIMVGDRADDRGFAERNGFEFVEAETFFAPSNE